MIAYKLLRRRKDGSLGSLFVKRGDVLPLGKWLQSDQNLRPKGLKVRPGWHCVMDPKKVKHLKRLPGRVWALVRVQDYETLQRPETQGGLWVIAQRIKILGILTKNL